MDRTPPRSFWFVEVFWNEFTLSGKPLLNKMRYILWVMALLEACDVTNNGCHLGFYQELEIRIKLQEMVIFCALHGRWHINKRFAGFLPEDLLLLLKEGEKTCKLAWPPATFYVIFCNHSSRPSSNLPQNLREGWTNSFWKHQMLMFYPLGKNLEKPNGGITSQDYHSRVNESGFGILVAPLI